MKKVGLVFIGLAVILFIIHWIIDRPTYTSGEFEYMHTSVPVAASFVLGAGAALLLAGYNIDRQEKRRNMTHRNPKDK